MQTIKNETNPQVIKNLFKMPFAKEATNQLKANINRIRKFIQKQVNLAIFLPLKELLQNKEKKIIKKIGRAHV